MTDRALDCDLARLSSFVYDTPWQRVERNVAAIGWIVLDVFDHAGSQAMLCQTRAGGRAALVFRGTEASRFRLRDLWANAGRAISWAGYGRAHSGYDTAFARIRWDARGMAEQISVETPTFVTGHSMGGALATLYASWADHRISGLVTFGAPKALDARAAKAIRADRVSRYVMPMDFAPSWPPVPGLTHPADETRLAVSGWWPGPISRHAVDGYVEALAPDRAN